MVLGNPPYGAKTSAAEKEYYKATYEAAKTQNGVKGSTDTFAVFINQGLNLLKKGGVLSFIVPMSFTSSDAMCALHNKIFKECETIYVSSYAVRPQPVFRNAVVDVSILTSCKTMTPCKNLYSTKMHRKSNGTTLQDLLDNLEFAKVNGLCLQGRIPKISSKIEVSILEKLQKCKKVSDFIKEKGKPIYYRAAGGRYFKVVTNYSTGSSAEKSLYFDKNIVDVIGCILSSNLSFWFYQIYADNHNWKSYEIGEFRVPPLTAQRSALITNLYASYLADIERNAIVHSSSGKSSYKVATFKEYKIRKSKALIDRIDDAICPLYGLTQEETEFIKNYEIEFRVDE